MSKVITKLLTELKANKAKSAVLGGLCLVLLVVCGRLLLPDSSTQTATAAPSHLVPPPQPAENLVRPMVVNSQIESTPQANSEKTTTKLKFSAQTMPEPVVIDDLPRSIERDLFTTPAWSKFVADDTMTAHKKLANSDSPVSNLFGGIASAVRGYQAEQKEQRLRDEKELAQMALQSTLTGPSPLAYISGKLVREGDSIQGFSVLRILDRRVILMRAGMTHILTMQ